MLFEIALLGAGIYAWEKFGKPVKNEVKRSLNKYVGGSTTMRHLDEVDRVQFGTYITNPYDTQYFEARWNDTVIPCANDLTKAITLMKTRLNPPARVRASCSICKEGSAYVHRWMFCCETPEAIEPMQSLMETVQSTYFG